MGRVNKAESKVTSMIGVMIILFMVAWTPYSIFALMEQFGPGIKPELAVIPALMAKSSICYNPIIYVGMNTQVSNLFQLIHTLILCYRPICSIERLGAVSGLDRMLTGKRASNPA